MNRKILFLVNPVSGTANKMALPDTIEKFCGKNNITFEILPTDVSGQYNWLPGKIEKDHISDVVICGGDGSVSQVTSCLLKTTVNIGIIPMGSGNGLAFTAGIPANIDKALEIVRQGKTFLVDAFMINDQYSCMLCGIGFDAQVAHDFARQKKRGFYTYVKQTIKNYLSCSPYPFRITLDGKTITTECYFVSIANSNQFGNNFKIAPRASLSDGLLDVVIVKKMNKVKLIFSILKQVIYGKVFSSGDIDKESILYFQVKSLNIHNTGNAPLHIDGEPRLSSPAFNIRLIEKAFLLIQP